MARRRLLAASSAVRFLCTVAANPAEAATIRFTKLQVDAEGLLARDSQRQKATPRAVRNGQYLPKVAPKVYADSYKALDRDHDRSMCEQDVG